LTTGSKGYRLEIIKNPKMKKNLYLLLFLVLLPLLLSLFYGKISYLSGNWMEDYSNYFVFGFLFVSLLGSGALFIVSYKMELGNARTGWLIFSALLVAFFIVDIYLGYSFTRIQIG